MSQSLFRGSGVALVTPMTPDGIDFPALEQLIEWHIASGTDALILCATTGEGATLTYAERAEIIRAARQEAQELVAEANRQIENTIRTIREAQAERDLTRMARQELDDFRQALSLIHI